MGDASEPVRCACGCGAVPKTPGSKWVRGHANRTPRPEFVGAGTAVPLADDEMVSILSHIARQSNNASARIAAIKQLRAIEESEAEAGRPKRGPGRPRKDAAPADSFDDLDALAADDLERQRLRRTA